MEKNWPWILVGVLVLLYVIGRERKSGGGIFSVFTGTPSNPTNPPASGCSFCGVGTIAPGAPSVCKVICGSVIFGCKMPPMHAVIPVCAPHRTGIPVIPFANRPQPLPPIRKVYTGYGMPHYAHCIA